jgi:hypothetical protein
MIQEEDENDEKMMLDLDVASLLLARIQMFKNPNSRFKNKKASIISIKGWVCFSRRDSLS